MYFMKYFLCWISAYKPIVQKTKKINLSAVQTYQLPRTGLMAATTVTRPHNLNPQMESQDICFRCFVNLHWQPLFSSSRKFIIKCYV